MVSQRLVLALFVVGLASLLSGVDSQERCTFQGETYKVGETFIDESCEYLCMCNKGGPVSCVDLCPTIGVSCKPDERVAYKNDSIVESEGRCFCPRPYCEKSKRTLKKSLPVSDSGVKPNLCVEDGVTYNVGDSFINKECTGRCKCEERGGISCVDLCPPIGVSCKPDERVAYKKDPIADSEGRCFCPRPYCEKSKVAVKNAPVNVADSGIKSNVCVVDGVTYNVGDRFINKECTGRCKCEEEGSFSCVDLCSPFAVSCKPDEREALKNVPVADSEGRCFCTRPYCVKTDVCVGNGVTYNVGDRFINKECTGRCTCDKGGVISCVDLCPTIGVSCKPEERVAYENFPVADSEGRCFCPRPYCEKSKVAVKNSPINVADSGIKSNICVVDGVAYNVGDRFINKECNGRCKCDKGGVFSCVNLCPPVRVSCAPGQTKLTQEVAVSKTGGRCYCVISTCI